jgi:hypothetical protein
LTTIEVTVSPKGETTLETKGFTGAACRDASRALEQALGTRTAERLTAGFFEQSREVDQGLRQSP